MTPQQFADAYLHTAQLVTAGTGINAYVLLAQWANETDWGNVVVGNNLGNIRCSPTTFCQFATLEDFAQTCIATFHNGYYAAVLAAVTPAEQLAAIVASPWDAHHYGGSLAAFYTQLPVPPPPSPPPTPRRSFTMATATSLHQFCRGADNALWHRRRKAGAWSDWTRLGGALGTDVVAPAQDEQGALVASVVGTDAKFYDFVSTDDGLTWAESGPHGGGDGLVAVGAAAAAAVDLSPVLQAIQAISVSALSPAQAAQLQQAADILTRLEAAFRAA